jgi:PAS domain S-box-containing protein
VATTSKKTHESSQEENVFRQEEQYPYSLVEYSSAMNESEHFVQFFETDSFLIHSLSEFIGAGLRAGEACIILTTKLHRESFEERLKQEGLQIDAVQKKGQYIPVDAAATLAEFMVDGWPDAVRFAEVIGSIISRAAQGWRRVRIFGELVSLLWADGNRAAASRLEELWNDLGKSHSFLLLCAYPMYNFGGEKYEKEFIEICKQHSRVIPAESYTNLSSPDERLRAISLLQQKAKSLEVEIAGQEEAEKDRLRLAAIVEFSNDAIIGKTLDGVITDWNNAAEHLFGYTAQEAIGKHITLIIPPELHQEEEEIIRKLRQGIPIQHFDTVRMRKDGKYVDVSLSISPIQDSRGKIIGVAKIARDITERKDLERRKDEFISMASHELKTPVTSIKGFTQLLVRRFQQRDDKESLRFLARMDIQLTKLTKLISDLLDISKMQSGHLEYRKEPFELDMLVQEMIENVQGTTQTHRLILDNPARVCVYADRDRIGQVLMNLLTNAIKFSAHADKVLVQVLSEGPDAVVRVQDFGLGIDEAHHEKIFERFYQVSESDTKHYAGLGIGLYISSEIIKRHQGRIWVESRKGEGSTFSFSLPLLEDTSPMHSEHVPSVEDASKFQKVG